MEPNPAPTTNPTNEYVDCVRCGYHTANADALCWECWHVWYNPAHPEYSGGRRRRDCARGERGKGMRDEPEIKLTFPQSRASDESLTDFLVCDHCGAIHRDDEAALSESCPCSRFKQHMEWATPMDMWRHIEALHKKFGPLEQAK